MLVAVSVAVVSGASVVVGTTVLWVVGLCVGLMLWWESLSVSCLIREVVGRGKGGGRRVKHKRRGLLCSVVDDCSIRLGGS